MMTLEGQLTALEKNAFYRASQERALEITGADTAPFLHRLTTQDVLGQPVGSMRYAALLDRKGMVLSLFRLLRKGEEHFILLLPDLIFSKTMDLLQRVKIIDRIDLSDRTADFQSFFLFGPVTGSPKGLVWKETIYQKELRGILCPRSELLPLEDFLHSLPEIMHEAFDLVRIESGIPEYGVDLDERRLALEANLHFAIARNKGCYPGQEVVERIYSYGKGRTPRSLCRLESVEKDSPITGTPLYDLSEKEIGRVTSSRWDPLKKKTLLLAYLERHFSQTPLPLKKVGDRWVV